MMTDKERRDVAARLRDWTWKSAPPECLLNQLVFGEDCPGTDDDPDTIGCAECERMAAKRLADLIEPVQGGTCAECAEFDRASKITPCRAFHGHTEANVTACDDFKPMKCDRDALLALADEMKRDTGRVDELQLGIYGACYLSGMASRIREALGVER